MLFWRKNCIYPEGRFWVNSWWNPVVVSGIITAAEAGIWWITKKASPMLIMQLVCLLRRWHGYFLQEIIRWCRGDHPVNFDASEDNDVDNYNPSIGVSGNFIHVFYMDEKADQVIRMRLDTPTDTKNPNVCMYLQVHAFYCYFIYGYSGLNFRIICNCNPILIRHQEQNEGSIWSNWSWCCFMCWNCPSNG